MSHTCSFRVQAQTISLALHSTDENFFDLLSHECCHSLLAALGMPTKILMAERSCYLQFRNCFKINRAISRMAHRGNGFVQGCSHSLFAAQAILSVWTRGIEALSGQSCRLRAGGFLDDSNFRVQGG